MNARSIVIAVACCILSMQAAAIDASDRYRSPRNPERKVRRSTELIVLHTTEAPARSSLNKVSERGECHFCVTEAGAVYRIVDRDREAFHAGRSMWNGKEDVDKYSVGIECVGHHDKPMSSVQLNAISRLVKELQAMYRIPDHCVVAHSHVAYGAPNKWQKCRHRGRKRCGMLFATPTVRRLLGLKSRPASDADVRARRLTIGDEYLNQVLYGRGDFMARRYPNVTVAAARPALVSKAPAATPPRPRPANKASVKAPKAVTSPPKSVTDLKARGYRLCGTLKSGGSAVRIAGKKWNAADTYYVIRGKLKSGKDIDASRLEEGTQIWMR